MATAKTACTSVHGISFGMLPVLLLLLLGCGWRTGQAARTWSGADLAADASLAAAKQLQTATHTFIAELPPKELTAVRRTRLAARLEKHGVPVPKMFEWFVLLSAFGNPNADDGHPPALATSKLPRRGASPPARGGLAQVASRTRPAEECQHVKKAVACVTKRGRTGKWQRRLFVLYKGKLTYRISLQCSNDWFSLWRASLGMRTTFDLAEEMLPGNPVEALSADELNVSAEEVKDDASHCIMIPLKKRDFHFCFHDASVRDPFFEALQLHLQCYAARAGTGLAEPQAVDTAEKLKKALSDMAGDNRVPDMYQSEDSIWDEMSAEEMLGAMHFNPESVDMERATTSLEALKLLYQVSEKLNTALSSTPRAGMDELTQRRRLLNRSMAQNFFGTIKADPGVMEEAAELQANSSEMGSDIDHVFELLQEISQLSWADMTYERGSWFAEVLKGAGRWMVREAISIEHQWASFKSYLSSQERRCTQMGRQQEDEAQAKAGMDLAGLKQRVKDQREVPEVADIIHEVHKAESAMEAMAGTPEEQQQADHNAHLALEELRASGVRVEAAAYSRRGQGSLVQEAARHGERAAAAIERMCQRSLMDEAAQMRETAQAARAPNFVAPNLGLRGVSAYAGLFTTMGWEEVLDFRNLEIGYFNWRATSAGANMGSLAVGGYVGIGWKGNKENWTLQEAHTAAVSSSFIPHFPFVPATGHITTATDADDSGTVWKPDLDGVKRMMFGWSMGLFLDLLGGFYRVSATRYEVQTTECFNTTADFLTALWGMTCTTCEGEGERLMIGRRRATAHLSSFLGITDLLFALFAKRNEERVPKDYIRGCSAFSTRYRHDRRYAAAKVGRELMHAMGTLSSAQGLLDELQKDLEDNFNDAQLEIVMQHPLFEELWDKFKRFGCSRVPLSLVNHLEPGNPLKVIKDLSFIHSLARLPPADDKDPFGTCFTSSQCPLPGQICAKAEVDSDLVESTCTCQEDFCVDEAFSECSSGQKRIIALLRGIKVWISAQELRVGDMAVKLKEMREPLDSDEDWRLDRL